VQGGSSAASTTNFAVPGGPGYNAILRPYSHLRGFSGGGAVTEAFDPYHRWLGIPPKDQPPHYYRLLGLDLFENDGEVVVDAVQRQMAHVRTYQLGPNSAMAQEILNELGAAKACLLNPQKKALYDEQLRKELNARVATVEPPPLQAAVPPPPSTPPAAQQPRQLVAAAGTAAVLLCLALGAILFRGETKRKIVPAETVGERAPAVPPPLPSPKVPPRTAVEPMRVAAEDAAPAHGAGRLPKPELDLVFEPGGVFDIAGHARLVVSGKIMPVAGLGRRLAGRFENACITLGAVGMGTSPFTVEVLARPGKSIGTAQMFLCWQKSNDRVGFYFARRGDAVRVAYPTESGVAKIDWPITYEPARWYHLAAVRDLDGVYVYVNGEKAFAGKPAIADLPTKAYPLTIGDNSVRHAPYTGDLQFVRLYRAALTQEQVRIRAALALGGKR